MNSTPAGSTSNDSNHLYDKYNVSKMCMYENLIPKTLTIELYYAIDNS